MDMVKGESSLPYMGGLDSAGRNAALKLIARSVGIELEETRVPEGESFIPIGEQKMRALRDEVAALPDLIPGLATYRERIASEKHVDVEVPIQQVRMEPRRGGLYGKGNDEAKALAYTNTGMGQVVSFIKPADVRQGAVSVLKSVSPAVRAQVFNEWAEKARTEESKVFLRTAMLGTRRVIRAVTSPKHSLEFGDDNAIAVHLAGSLPKGGKLRIQRDQDRTDFEILFPMMSREIRVGDAVMAKVHVSNSETKQGSWRVFGGILRALCFNFTTAWCGKDTEVAGRHMGESVGKEIAKAVQQAMRNVEPFVQAFGDAYSNELPDFAPTKGEVLDRVAKALELPEWTLTRAATLWDADGSSLSAGNTLAGLVNALTRASQETDMEQALLIEGAAGRLVVQGWATLN